MDSLYLEQPVGEDLLRDILVLWTPTDRSDTSDWRIVAFNQLD